MNLAARMRPTALNDYVGQEELVGQGRLIRRMIESDSLSSIILWGPPGSGKTTLASIIAHETDSDFHLLSAVSTGKEDLQKIIKEAKEHTLFKKKTILFHLRGGTASRLGNYSRIILGKMNLRKCYKDN